MSDLLPANATDQERAISDSVARLGSVPVHIGDLWNAESCPNNLLAWLAWAFSVDEWDSDWSDDQKRTTIKRSVVVHRHKGTIGAVRTALNSLSFNARVQEWFNQIPSGAPYTFRLLVEAAQVGIPQSGYRSLLTVVENTKNLRSHLTAVELSVKTQTGPKSAAVASLGTEITVEFGGSLELGYVNSGYVDAGYVV